MLSIKTIAVASLTALLLTTSLAQAGGILLDPPKKGIIDTGPPLPGLPGGPSHDSGPRFDPADFFTQDFIDRQPKKVEQPPSQAVSQLSCGFQNYNQDGSSFGLTFKNTGDTIIPQGSKFVIIMPDGQPKIFVVQYDIPPGWGMGIKDLFDGGFPENWTCSLVFISA